MCVVDILKECNGEKSLHKVLWKRKMVAGVVSGEFGDLVEFFVVCVVLSVYVCVCIYTTTAAPWW